MLEILEGRQLPSMTFTVTSTGDVGPNTLRQAILNANANPGADLINFNISGPGGHVIQPATPLPQITDAVTIDGTTQPGYAGTPLIQLDGTLAGTGANGLSITKPKPVRKLFCVLAASGRLGLRGKSKIFQLRAGQEANICVGVNSF